MVTLKVYYTLSMHHDILYACLVHGMATLNMTTMYHMRIQVMRAPAPFMT